ncbi:MAG: enoyl-ACP reductase FabI [Aquabacterium sp.]|nr:enoyl-ACP reductase FabI [Aquabacterium sp.]
MQGVDPSKGSLPLSGRRGLVLGVANEHSIAWGCAREAARQGARLVLSCLNDKARAVCEPLAREIDAPLLCCDVEAPGALAAVVQQAAAQLGGLDFAVHSIAWAPLADLHGRVMDSSPAGFARTMEVSCHSFAELAHCCEPLFAQAGGGALVTMSYHGAVEPVAHYGLMGPVKAALEALVRYLATELGPRNVRVHAVSPGPVPTRAAGGLEDFDGLMADARARAPLRRLVTLQEIGSLAAFLVGDGASGMTGQTLYVDAGHHIVR